MSLLADSGERATEKAAMGVGPWTRGDTSGGCSTKVSRAVGRRDGNEGIPVAKVGTWSAIKGGRGVGFDGVKSSKDRGTGRQASVACLQARPWLMYWIAAP